MACGDAASCDGACPYHSGHEEQLTHHESRIGDAFHAIERTDERILAAEKKIGEVGEKVIEVSTTVKVGVAVGAAAGAASGTAIGLLIAWFK